jgi:lipopolysaccharide biosynthesis glycosyltransferase
MKGIHLLPLPLPLLLLLLLLLACGDASQRSNRRAAPAGFTGAGGEHMNIASAIDNTSATLSLIKTHSIIQSTANKQMLFFRFLVVDEALLEPYKLKFSKLFPGILVEYKLFNAPLIFSKFSNKNYERASVFARLFFPMAFPHVDRFLYLDNDIVVNADIADIYGFPLFNRLTRSLVSSGFTVEHSQHHSVWVKAHFNLEHPLYKESLVSQRNSMRYLNSGVWLCNATLWREKKLTERALDIVERSFTEFIYNRNVTSDQEVLYLLLHKDDVADLPLRFNMGMHSYQKFVELSHQKTGFVHFAAFDKKTMCTKPMSRQPRVSCGAMAYFLTVSRALKKLFRTKLPDAKMPYMLSDCDKALNDFLVMYKNSSSWMGREPSICDYNPGLGGFVFPPPPPNPVAATTTTTSIVRLL